MHVYVAVEVIRLLTVQISKPITCMLLLHQHVEVRSQIQIISSVFVSQVDHKHPLTHSDHGIHWQGGDQHLLSHLWDLGRTPIHVDKLGRYLKQYPDQQVANELLGGFSRGFKLQYTGPRFSVWSNNLVSASQLREHTINKLKKEIDEGRILGPFTYKPISTLRISPIGLVPKSDGSFRLITHLSFPKGNSINDFIDDELCKVKYASLDNVLDMVYNLGPETLLGKIDIKSAFRLLIVNPADFDLLGIYFYLSRYNDFQVRSKVHYGYGYI